MKSEGTFLLAESPRYDERVSRLYFTDILAGQLCIRSEGRALSRIDFSSFATSVHLTEDPETVLVTTRDSLYLYDCRKGKKHFVIKAVMPDDMRFNDGAVSPEGCLYMGTMKIDGPRSREGALYRIDSTSAEIISEGYGIPNGLVFQDEKTFFHVDSSLDIVRKYELVPSGLKEVMNHRFEGGACPDGMTAGSDGMLYVALWNRGEIACLRAHDLEEAGARITGFKTSLSSVAIGPGGRAFATSAEDENGPGLIYEIKLDAEKKGDYLWKIK